RQSSIGYPSEIIESVWSFVADECECRSDDRRRLSATDRSRTSGGERARAIGSSHRTCEVAVDIVRRRKRLMRRDIFSPEHRAVDIDDDVISRLICPKQNSPRRTKSTVADWEVEFF